MPRSPLLRSVRLDEIIGALDAQPLAGSQAGTDLDLDVSQVNPSHSWPRTQSVTQLAWLASPAPACGMPAASPNPDSGLV